MINLEKMNEFFAARVEGYDEHMLENVSGCKDAYIEISKYVPSKASKLLDLGCGTGLQLEHIFALKPQIRVTGIDLTQEMLDRLSYKYQGKNINLICGSYFDVELGQKEYDCAISFQTMHHFTKEKKLTLYKRLYESLNKGAVYVECDYMVNTQEEEDHFFSENERIRKEKGIPEDEFYHYDTPCTIENQRKILQMAGFSDIQLVFRVENTTILVAHKK